jgi:hypothetical protein
MLKSIVVVAVWLIALMGPWTASGARDYLKKGEQQSDEPEQWEINYDRAVRHCLWRGWQKDVVVRTVHLPPFDPEWIGGVVHSQNDYRAFHLEASRQIWGASHDKQNLSRVRAIYKDKQIPESIAQRIAAIWRTVLADRRNYGKDPGLYLDTSHLIFFVGFLPGEHLSTNTALPDRSTNARELWNVTVALLDYADGRLVVAALERAVDKSEKKISASH